jgi:hypothetical protein
VIATGRCFTSCGILAVSCCPAIGCNGVSRYSTVTWTTSLVSLCEGRQAYWLGSIPARSGNLMIIKFEELRRDPHKVLAETFQFLEVPMKADVIGRAVENNTVERMRAKEDRAPKEIFRRAKAHDIRFVNSGSVSGWKRELTSEQTDAIERYATVPLQRLGYAVGTR